MSTRANLFLVLLTACYLTLELGFNARLLDAMGSNIDADQIDGLETCGRLLSGTALALFVLQVAMHVRAHLRDRLHGLRHAAYALATIAACLGTVYGVYHGLERLTERLVDTSSDRFRRSCMSATLAKSSLLDGSLRLGELPEQAGGFTTAQGKAFVSLLPLFAVSMDTFDTEFAPERKPALARAVAARLGDAQGYYSEYRTAIGRAHDQWLAYREADPERIRARVARDLGTQQEQAWAQYVRDLGRHGLSPYTVPYDVRDRVRHRVQATVPVPDDWDPSDEQGFRDAVERKVRQAVGRRIHARSTRIESAGMPPGLQWEAFLAHPTVQEQLRKKLGLPRQVSLRPRYDAGAQFEREVFQAAINMQVAQRFPAYGGSASDYADGARFGREGRAAARAVIVAPLALFCSLVGALMHMTKLTLMLCYAGLKATGAGRRHAVAATLVIVLAALAGAGTLCFADNAITASRAYAYLETRTGHSEQAPVRAALIARAMHGVAVGQGLFFPLDEAIRTKMLFNLSYGFNPTGHEEKK